MSQAEILAKLRKTGAAAHQKVKDAEASVKAGPLPAGIKGGTSKVTNINLDDKGKGPYIYLYSTVVTPDSFKGAFCGKLYQLYETQYRSYEDNLAEFYNDMKLFGYESLITKAKDPGSAIEKVMEQIVKDGPVIEFDTGNKLQKDGSARIFFKGLADSQAVDVEDDVQETPKKTKPAVNGKAKGKSGGSMFDDEDEEEEVEDTEEDKDDEDEDEEEEADDEEDEEEDAEYVPSVGDEVTHTGLKPPKEVEVVKVFKSRKTATVKATTTGKEYKEVPWSKLSQD